MKKKIKGNLKCFIKFVWLGIFFVMIWFLICWMLFINNVVVKKEKLYGFDKLKIFIIVYWNFIVFSGWINCFCGSIIL